MADLCADNRFDLIEKYKKQLIEVTNIETSTEEMKVLDNILFRFWQMGWLEKMEQPEPEIVRCKDCKWWGYDDDDGVVRVCHAAKHGHMSSNWDIMIYRTHKGDFYCSDAERRTDE